MFKRATSEPDLPAFSELPVQSIVCGSGAETVAVHIHGDLNPTTIPVVCVPGYVRNMADFAPLPAAINRLPDAGFTFVLLDLPGRGRSARLSKKVPYSTPRDADTVLDILAALDISRAIIMGQGHGGQVAMLAARKQPGVVAGAILIDAGPVTDPRGLVRTRNNHIYVAGLGRKDAARAALRKILAADYPGETETRLDALGERVYGFDRHGRVQSAFDTRLIDQLGQFDFDDVLEAQWPLFDCLAHAPLMLIRTRLSDQLRASTFDEMANRRSDAATLTISGQGSPALLDGTEERDAIAAFLRMAARPEAEN